MAGDTVAVGALLGRIHPMVVRYCRARLSGGHRSLMTADDIAQEVCMAVLNALPSYRREGRPFLAFVYGIAGNKIVDAHRAAGRSKSNPVADFPDVISGDPSPEQVVVDAAVAARMHELLKELPINQREILHHAGGGRHVGGRDGARPSGRRPVRSGWRSTARWPNSARSVAGDDGLAEQLL